MKFSLLSSIFILFGIFKLASVIAITWFIPHDIEEKLSKIPIVNTIISGDKSLAGKMIDYIILAFALFTLVHGLAIMDVLPASLTTIFESKLLHYSVYTLLALFSIVFYSLVLYTEYPISKNPSYYGNYKIYGFLSGFSFLLIPLLWELGEFIFPMLDKLSTNKKLIYITLLAVLGLGGLTGFYYLHEKVKEGLRADKDIQ
jgi:hypothetical protein